MRGESWGVGKKRGGVLGRGQHQTEVVAVNRNREKLPKGDSQVKKKRLRVEKVWGGIVDHVEWTVGFTGLEKKKCLADNKCVMDRGEK